MRLHKHSLFLKIFLWFWATVIVIGIALVVTFLLQPGRMSSRWHDSLANAARYSGAVAVEEAELHGTPAASFYMKQMGGSTHMHACLFDEAGNAIAGEGCELFARNISLVRSKQNVSIFTRDGIARVAMPIQSSGGRKYIYAAEIPTGTPTISRTAIAVRVCVVLLVSFCICYLLARYLTVPILRLREASQLLAAGDLSTRASADMERRNDELGFLVRDFNAMAGRIEELISRQRQLIYDISHELRSPLARLNVALDLARERKGNNSAFDHMEQDIERMSEMIGRMLTVAKLDTSSAPVQMTRIDLSELVSQVVRSAEFELRERDNAVRLTIRGLCFVRGNAELLQSAVENVIRNAARYTTSDASVDIHVERLEREDGSFILLSVRDYGVGVPESELSNIFRPFYRVANDRDRQSGGAGLGLAIADRVARVHGGTVRAQNAAPQGLRVDIFIPAAGKE
ncbi:MAG TPA: ATP-binding protein [Edaphobacter sp.]|nr:ATP-binding protein [Edaphobacter sp.]